MKKLPKTNSPEILCVWSMGNEPGRNNAIREFTPAARVLRRREIDHTTDPKRKRQLLRDAAAVTANELRNVANQVKKMRESTKNVL